jgi:selenocysteine-specific elongation factor
MRVVGTAGHVDHGKSTLIQALTGIDPDRLREEKERGMTIDLGFAWLRLPNGVEVSIVDVPGHERFIHNMLAGVGGIDIALLVIAADEGIMPQTREHLAILDLLGIRNGVVALTKRDLVDEEWLELVQADVEETLKGTTLAGAPIIACSSITGEGLDRLKEALQALLTRERTRPITGRPRLPVDRVFTVAGFGTVVTGTLIDGELRLGQELEVQPGGLRTRVRGLQSHKKKLDLVPAGTRTAVNVSGLAVDQLRRGQVLAAPGALRPTRAVDARLRLIEDARPLAHNTRVGFHTGAAETLGRVKLLDRAELQPGEEAWVQVSLQDELAVAKGDLFIVRQPSPSVTLGGGTIVEPHARRHRRHQQAVLELLAVLAQGTPEEVILQQLRAREPTDVDELMRRAGLPVHDTQAAIHRLLESKALLALDAARNGATHVDGRTFVVSASGWEALASRVESVLGTHHRTYPLRRGLPKEELRTRLGVDTRLFGRMLDQLKAQGLVAEDGPFVRLSSHVVRFTPEQERQVALLLDVLGESGVAPPDRADWESALRISPELTDALVTQGTLVEVAPGLVYDRQTLDMVLDGIRDAIQREGPLTVARIRDLLGASRKYVLALVAYTDEHKITRRVGDERVLY